MGRIKIEITLVAIIGLLAILFAMQLQRIASLKAERDRNARNTASLMEDVQTYKVRDSLNAAKVGALELSLKEFKRYRAEDARLIADLKARNRDLDAISGTQTSTTIDITTIVHDTLYLRDTGLVAGKVLKCGDAWYDFEGQIEGDTFTGRMESRDSLLLVETVRYKRFLGFLWKTSKVKDRQMDAVSRNPHTKILALEHTIINN